MVRTETTFTTSSKVLKRIYDGARDVLLSSVKSFGTRRVLTSGSDSATTTLHSEVIGAAIAAALKA